MARRLAPAEEEDDREWRRLLADEYGNFRSAIGWAIESGRTDEALELCDLLTMYWEGTRSPTEGRRLTEQALSLPGGDALLRARAQLSLAYLLAALGSRGQAEERVRGALDLLATIPEQPLVARAYVALGDLQPPERVEASFDAYRAALEVATRLQHTDFTVMALRGRAGRLLRVGGSEECFDLCEQARVLLERAGDEHKLAAHIGLYGVFARHAGDGARASRLFAEALDIHRRIGDLHRLAWTIYTFRVAAHELDSGRFDEAAELGDQLITIGASEGVADWEAHGLWVRAQVARARGDHSAMPGLLGRAIAKTFDSDHVAATMMRAELLPDLARAEAQIGTSGDPRVRVREAVALAHRMPSALTKVWLLHNCALSFEELGDTEAELETLGRISPVLDEVYTETRRPVRFLMAWADVQAAAGAAAEAESTLREAIASAQGPTGEPVMLRWSLGRLLRRRGRAPEAVAVLREGLADVEAAPYGMRARYLEQYAAAAADADDVAALDDALGRLAGAWRWLGVTATLLRAVARSAAAQGEPTEDLLATAEQVRGPHDLDVWRRAYALLEERLG